MVNIIGILIFLSCFKSKSLHKDRPMDLDRVTRSVPYLGSFVRTLDSEKDTNYLFTNSKGKFIVVKVFTSKTCDYDVDLMVRVQKSVSTCVVVPRIIYDGKLEDGTKFIVSEYLEGRMLSNLSGPETLDYFSLGREVGKLTESLSSFPLTPRKEPLVWNLKNFETVARGTISFMKIFEFVTDRLKSIKTTDQICHYDLNDDNVLISPHGEIGFLDFGDVDVGPRVTDLAICICYCVINLEADLLVYGSTIKLLLNGFGSVSPLSLDERRLVSAIVIGRSLMSLCIQTANRDRFPENSQYLSVSIEGNERFLNLIAFGNNLCEFDRFFSDNN